MEDNVGNLLHAVETYGHASVNDRTVTNTYDRAYRLATETLAETGSSITVTTYQYDKANNRTQKSVSIHGGTPVVTTSQYGTTADGYNSNQLKSASDGTTTTEFTYDLNGNRYQKKVNGTDASSYDKGFFMGRTVFELASIFVPGGVVLKGLAKGSKFTKLQFLEKVGDIPFFQSNGKVASALADVKAGLGAKLATSKMCFIAGTIVAGASSCDDLVHPTPIEQITEQSLVWARNEVTGEVEKCRVLQLFKTHPDHLHHVSIDTDGDGQADETLSGTAEHPFWNKDSREWVRMGDLVPGNRLELFTRDSEEAGGLSYVLANNRQNAPPGETFTTYNLEVEGFHTYFVSDSGIWVHNQGKGEPCDRLRSLLDQFKIREGGDTKKAWAKVERRVFGAALKKDTARTAGAVLDDLLRKEILPGHQGAFFTSKKGVSETDNLGLHVWKHIYDRGDMADIAPDGVTYVQRALNLSSNTVSNGGILVAEGVRARSGVLERLVLNQDTGEFTIKVLAGDQAGRMRTLFRPESPVDYFNDQVAQDALTLK